MGSTDTGPFPASSADTTMMNAPAGAGPAAGGEPHKLCCVCGVNVAGQKRFKDSSGYWCLDCHRADARKSGRVLKVRCPDCQKSVAENLMAEYQGRMLCSGCKFDHTTADQKTGVRMILAARSRTERNRVKMQIAIAASVLLGVYLLYQFGFFGGAGAKAAAEQTNDTRTLLQAARTAGLVFLAMLVGFIFWVKRQV